MIHSLKPIIEAHPFFADVPEELIELITGCARNLRFKAGHLLMRQGEPADNFYLIRSGHVVLTTHGAQRGPLAVQTTGEGEMIGMSWLVPPHRYRFDGKAVETTTVLAFDGKCLRDKLRARPDLGFILLERIAMVLTQRLENAQMRLLDVYGAQGQLS